MNFLRTSKIRSMLHYGLLGRGQGKMLLYFHISYFWHFLLFFIKNYVFIISIYFFNEVSNFLLRIINQSKAGIIGNNLSLELYVMNKKLVALIPKQSFFPQKSGHWD